MKNHHHLGEVMFGSLFPSASKSRKSPSPGSDENELPGTEGNKLQMSLFCLNNAGQIITTKPPRSP